MSKTPKPGSRIVFDNVSKKYKDGEPAVKDFSLDIEPGEFIVFVGPSGCGKTTTMKMTNKLIHPSSGKIFIDGQDITDLDDNILRRGIGYVIQQIGLFPHMTIGENIAVVPELLKWDKAEIAERVDELLELVELDPAEYRDRYPRELSGGQQQRVGVARALAADPPILLMDEPFGATDPITRENLQDQLLAVHRKLKKTIIFVTHDFEEALKMGDRILVLGPQSRIEQCDTPAHILANPSNEYVESFIGSGTNIKHLSLLEITPEDLGPTSEADKDAPTIPFDSTLRDALDAVVGADGNAVIVVNEDEVPTGSISIDAIAQRLGSEVSDIKQESE